MNYLIYLLTTAFLLIMGSTTTDAANSEHGITRKQTRLTENQFR